MKNKKLFIILLIVIFLCTFGILYLNVKPMKVKYVYQDENFDQKYIVEKNTTTTFYYTIDNDLLDGLALYNSVSSDETIYNLDFTIYNENSEIIYMKHFEKMRHYNPTLLLFKDEILNSKGSQLKIVIKNNSVYDLILKSNSDRTKFFKVVTKKENYNLMKWLFVALIILLVLFFYRFFNISYIKYGFIYYFIFSLLLAILMLYYDYIIYYKTIKNYAIPISIIILLLLYLLIYIGVNLYKNNSHIIEKLFLILAIPVCSFCCIFILPNDTQDEYKHYAESYKIATFQFGEEVEVPSIISDERGFENIEYFFKMVKSDYNYSDTKTIQSTGYNPILYLFSSMGIAIGKLLNLNPYIGWYIAKLINMIICLLLGYFSVKYMPRFKWFTILYFLMPMNISQIVSLSADAILNCTTIFLVAFSLKKYLEHKKLSKIDYLILLLLGITIVFSKYVYAPIYLSMLYLVINRNNLIKKINKKVLYTVLFIIVIAALCIFFYKFSIANQSNEIYMDNSYIYALTHPIETEYTFINYIINSFDLFTVDMIGYHYVWRTCHVNFAFPMIYAIILIISLFDKTENIFKIEKKSKIIIILFSVCSIILLLFALFCFEQSSNPVINYINGIQGRYFIPVYFGLFTVIFSNVSIFKRNIKMDNFYIISFSIIQLIYLYNIFGFVVR